MLANLLTQLFSFLFPPICIICGTENTVINICDSCKKKLELTREMRKPWLFSLYRYRADQVATLIKHLKNFPDQDMVNELLHQKQFMIENWTTGLVRVFDCTHIIIIPAPLHTSRFIDRGYNQADIIAQAYRQCITQKMNSLQISISIENNLIVKSKKTDKQALIHDRQERMQNIKNAFTIQNQRDMKCLADSLVIIIDDVTTTGGTVNEIRTLLLPHAKTVFAFTLAH